MAKLLFIDACARGWEVSGTYTIAEAFLEAYQAQNPEDEVEELNLTEEHLTCLTGRELAQRDALLKKGGLNDIHFHLARQFAAADKIVIAAPYWDLSFPALLKVYIEHLCVLGITFAYGEQGEELGLCKAEKLLYITTSGGVFPENTMSVRGTGVAYLKALFGIFGIEQFDCIWGQGLDIIENDRGAIIAYTQQKAVVLAKSW